MHLMRSWIPHILRLVLTTNRRAFGVTLLVSFVIMSAVVSLHGFGSPYNRISGLNCPTFLGHLDESPACCAFSFFKQAGQVGGVPDLKS